MHSRVRQFAVWTALLAALLCALAGFAQDTPTNKVTPKVTPIPSVTRPGFEVSPPPGTDVSRR